MEKSDYLQDLPMGFGMALLQNQGAAQYFESLTYQERQQILDQTHQITSKQDMQEFVRNLQKS